MTGFSQKCFTILLAEDEVIVRNLLHRVLATRGYEVLVSANGREALELAQAFHGAIDLLVSDVQMPEMNGVDLAAAMRIQRPETGILLMSGRISATTTIASENLDDFIRKPFLPKVFIERVEQLLTRRQF